MITALDTNVLFDILVPGSAASAQSKSLLDKAYREGGLIIGETVYAELASFFPSRAQLDRFLGDTAIRLQPSTPETLWMAGQRWRRYSARRPAGLVCPGCGNAQEVRCSRCGHTIAARQHVLSDFLIGAHAVAYADRLLTRDRGYYSTYFPELRLL